MYLKTVVNPPVNLSYFFQMKVDSLVNLLNEAYGESADLTRAEVALVILKDSCPELVFTSDDWGLHGGFAEMTLPSDAGTYKVFPLIDFLRTI